MGSLLAELKRRKVFRVAAVYAVVAWLLIQVADVVLPTFGAPAWVNQTLIFLFIVGLPIALVLAWAYEVTPAGIQPDHGQAPAPVPAAQSQGLMYAIFVLLLVAVGFQIGDRSLFSSPAGGENSLAIENSRNANRTLRYDINLGTIERQSNLGDIVTALDFTSDGTKLVYSSLESGIYRINLRDLAQLQVEVVYSSEEVTGNPRISPDGSHIAFMSGLESRDLLVIPVNSSSPRLVASNVLAASYAWLDNQRLIYHDESAIPHDYSLATDESTQLAAQGWNQGAGSVYRLPDPIEGTDFVLTTATSRVSYNNDKNIVLYNRATGQRELLISNGFHARFISTGHIVFMRDENLMAVGFDRDRLELVGSPMVVQSNIENTEANSFTPSATFAVSDEGQLLYLPGSDVGLGSNLDFVWVDRDGAEQRVDLPARDYNDPVLSPDGQRLAMTVNQNGVNDIWVHDFSQPGILTRITSAGGVNPLWSPDGQYLFFQRTGGPPGERGISRIASSGIGEPVPLASAAPATLTPRSFTPEGELLAVLLPSDGHTHDVLRLTPE